jgi:hypothetical protein
MIRYPYVERLFPTRVSLAVLIAVLTMWPARPEAGGKPNGATCRTDQQCSSGLCVKFTSPVGTCHLPTARWRNGEVVTFSQADWGGEVAVRGAFPRSCLQTTTLSTPRPSASSKWAFRAQAGSRSCSPVPCACSPTSPPAGLRGRSPRSASIRVLSRRTQFGGEVTALRLNVDFTAAALMLGLPVLPPATSRCATSAPCPG